jgi:predicted nucleotidyltransferase
MDKLKLAREFSRKLYYPEVERIILFGSVATGKDREDSDVDILMISRRKMETKDRVMEEVGQMLLDEGVYFSVKVISPEEYQKLKGTYFISQIEDEGVVLEYEN